MEHTFDLASAMKFAAGLAQPTTTSTDGAAGASVLIRNMPAHEYHGDRDALSCSMLKPILVSPAHYQAALAAHSKSSDAKDLGSLLHLLLLQPSELANEVAVFPGAADGRSATYKQFEAMHPDKLVVDEPTFASARRLADKTAATKFRGRELGRFIEESITEATVYFTEPVTGLRMRIRMDAYHPDVTFDLKSTRFAVQRAFVRDAIDRDYDLQAFMYSFGRCLYEGDAALKPFVFITAETSAPHSVSVLTAGQSFMDNGAKKFQACVTTYKACADTGYWPDLGGEGEIEIEPWQQFSRDQSWRRAVAEAGRAES